jgi:hypothetical protein
VGSWNVACGISNLSIRPESEVVLYIIVRKDETNDFYGPFTSWKVVSLPIQAEYLDYGMFKEIGTAKNSELFLDASKGCYKDLCEYPISLENLTGEMRKDPVTVKFRHIPGSFNLELFCVRKNMFDTILKTDLCTKEPFWFASNLDLLPESYSTRDQFYELCKKEIDLTIDLHKKNGLDFFKDAIPRIINPFLWLKETLRAEMLLHSDVINSKFNRDGLDKVIQDIVDLVYFNKFLSLSNFQVNPLSMGSYDTDNQGVMALNKLRLKESYMDVAEVEEILDNF